MALLEASGIGKNFGETHVLKDISLDLEQGEALAIIGSSGSGKTTLLRCINMLETADSGSITVDGGVVFDGSNTDKLSAQQQRENQRILLLQPFARTCGLCGQSFDLAQGIAQFFLFFFWQIMDVSRAKSALRLGLLVPFSLKNQLLNFFKKLNPIIG